MIAINGLRAYPSLQYRQLHNVLHQMNGIVGLNFEPSELPDFTNVYARKQQLK